MTEDTVAIEIPADVHARVERRLPRTDFDSVGAYVAFVSREVLSEVEGESDGEYDRTEDAEIEERLASLGYLDT
jgi:predicted secreted Zn-dependent protease